MGQGIAVLGDIGPDNQVSPSDALATAARLCESNVAEPGLALVRFFPKLGLHLERASNVADVRQVTAADIRAWIDSPFPGGERPSLSTLHSRRAAARLGFKLLRVAGIVGHDPTSDIRLPPRPHGRESRPLTDSEIALGRAASLGTFGETRRPAHWALAEATASTSEIPLVAPEDLDFSAGTVFLKGSSKLEARWAPCTDWGLWVLARRLMVAPTNSCLVYDGSCASPAAMRSAASMTLAKILGDAGLRLDPSVKVGSVRAWAGRRILVETGRIDEVALALGCKTLDTAAAIIGFDWRVLR